MDDNNTTESSCKQVVSIWNMHETMKTMILLNDCQFYGSIFVNSFSLKTRGLRWRRTVHTSVTITMRTLK
ncbi:hypothetical protein Y032_0002g540 [Ancylostoma ceylanicum]|uniref:Uncharacterized protein n=1 Tax=Ancylostoma ceylanicum TaxID=53326 RepID=A0A016W071_9BILA|nr:hypothetical protein Y032_0002g540 [Ancylostoma ceylanicum]